MNVVPEQALIHQLGRGETLDRIARNLRLADRSAVADAMQRHGLTRQRGAPDVIIIVQHQGRP